MKKHFLYTLFLVTVILFLCTCRDPIYYYISQEEELLEPLIKGSPTNFVNFNGNMYVASGANLYKYHGTNHDTNMGIWTDIRLSGNIFSLTVAGGRMYALCQSPNRKVLMVSDDAVNWYALTETGNHNVQIVYEANDMLFIATGEIGSYNIFVYDGAGNLREIANVGYNLLTGAAFDGTYYYLTTKDMISGYGGFIYSITETGLVSGRATALDHANPYTGIINTGSVIYTITRNGSLYIVSNNAIYIVTGITLNGRLATGALGIWEDKEDSDSNKMLLAGRQDTLGSSFRSGYTFGYMEAPLDASGNIAGNFDEPGKFYPSTVNVGDHGRFISTIGKYPVNHFFQADDGILFASTQQNGVWSYRWRKSGKIWNAEE